MLDDSHKRKYLLALLCLALAIALIFVYLAIPKLDECAYPKLADLAKSIIPSLITALIAFPTLYFILRTKGIDPAEELKFAVVRENAKVQETLQSEIDALSKKVSQLEQQNQVDMGLYKVISEQNEKAKDLILRLKRASPIMKELGNQMLNFYFQDFSIRSDGFHIKGEGLALYISEQIWKYLTEVQEKRRLHNEPALIARVIHSNSIHIWTEEHPKYKEMTRRLLTAQQKFCEAGGRIVRILIGKEKTASKDYTKAIENMKKYKIEAKYLSQHDVRELNYDFLILLDENFALKWYSGQYGVSVASAQVHDHIEREILESWDEMFTILKQKGTPIESIPDDRQYRRGDNSAFILPLKH
ncbi:MAG: hypothetical protein KF734_12040 [Saprospiraceae bacterium]|nr:hypothetical protein [Saprospiraceae bacterium]